MLKQTSTRDAAVALLRALADHLRDRRSHILADWARRTLRGGAEAVAMPRDRREFYDHIPQVLDLLERTLRSRAEADDAAVEEELAREFGAHGMVRWQQGFQLQGLIHDWNSLRLALLAEVFVFAGAHDAFSGRAAAQAATIVAELIGEGIAASVRRFEMLRAAESAGVYRDLEETVGHLRELLEAQRAEIAGTVHDVQGNLSVMWRLSEWLRRRSGGPDEEPAEVLAEGLQASIALLDELRLLAQLNARRVELAEETIEVGAVLATLVRRFEGWAQERDLRVTVEGPEAFRIVADGRRFARIAQNLLVNAIKFTRDGTISLRYGLAEGDRGWVLAVRNEGREFLAGHDLELGVALARATETLSEVHEVPSADTAHPVHDGNGSAWCGEAAPEAILPGLEHGEGIGLSVVKRLCDEMEARFLLELKKPAAVVATVHFPRVETRLPGDPAR